MLILRRKAGESLVIGDDITVAVLDINEGSVRLAIDAPKSITILRSELLQAASANRDAADGHASALLKFTERKPIRAFRPSRAKKAAASGRATAGNASRSTADAADAAGTDQNSPQTSGSMPSGGQTASPSTEQS